MAKVNVLPAHAFGRLQSASGDAARVAPALWAAVDIVPREARSERDAVRVWQGTILDLYTLFIEIREEAY